MPLFYNPITQVRDPDTDQPVSGALAYFYTTGTLTAADVYEDNALTTEHEQPVVAGADGVFPAIYLNPAITYRVRVTSPSGTLLRDDDPIAGGTAIGTDDITDNAVTTDKIADDAVTSSKIADQSVTNAQHVDMPALTVKANLGGSAGAPSDVTLRALTKALGLVGKIFASGKTEADTTLYLKCDGRAVSRETYADLYAAIGTTWGAGDGSTTFNLPDGRNRFLRGAASSGDGAHLIGTYQADALQDHIHTVALASNDSAGSFAADGSVTSGTLEDTSLVKSGSASVANETRPKNIAVDFVIYW